MATLLTSKDSPSSQFYNTIGWANILLITMFITTRHIETLTCAWGQQIQQLIRVIRAEPPHPRYFLLFQLDVWALLWTIIWRCNCPNIHPAEVRRAWGPQRSALTPDCRSLRVWVRMMLKTACERLLSSFMLVAATVRDLFPSDIRDSISWRGKRAWWKRWEGELSRVVKENIIMCLLEDGARLA